LKKRKKASEGEKQKKKVGHENLVAKKERERRGKGLKG